MEVTQSQITPGGGYWFRLSPEDLAKWQPSASHLQTPKGARLAEPAGLRRPCETFRCGQEGIDSPGADVLARVDVASRCCGNEVSWHGTRQLLLPLGGLLPMFLLPKGRGVRPGCNSDLGFEAGLGYLPGLRDLP